jgi:excisionase family DNA binding protein
MIKNTNKLQAYTITDVADFLKVTPRTIYKHLHKGIITGFKVGNKWRFTEEHILDYIQKLERKITLSKDEYTKEEPKEVDYDLL